LNRAASQASSGPTGQAGASNDDVVDAEFEEVDPRDKKAS
jgi:molecular chaperone DnaK